MPHGHCCVLAQEATVDLVQGRHIDFAPIISLIPFGPLIPSPTCLPVPLQGVNFRALIDLGRSDNFLSAGICDLLRLSRYPLKELLTMQLADGGYAFIDRALFSAFQLLWRLLCCWRLREPLTMQLVEESCISDGSYIPPHLKIGELKLRRVLEIIETPLPLIMGFSILVIFQPAEQLEDLRVGNWAWRWVLSHLSVSFYFVL